MRKTWMLLALLGLGLMPATWANGPLAATDAPAVPLDAMRMPVAMGTHADGPYACAFHLRVPAPAPGASPAAIATGSCAPAAVGLRPPTRGPARSAAGDSQGDVAQTCKLLLVVPEGEEAPLLPPGLPNCEVEVRHVLADAAPDAVKGGGCAIETVGPVAPRPVAGRVVVLVARDTAPAPCDDRPASPA